MPNPWDVIFVVWNFFACIGVVATIMFMVEVLIKREEKREARRIAAARKAKRIEKAKLENQRRRDDQIISEMERTWNEPW